MNRSNLAIKLSIENKKKTKIVNSRKEKREIDRAERKRDSVDESISGERSQRVREKLF